MHCSKICFKMAKLPFLLLAAGIVLIATYPVDITAASDCYFTPSAEVPEACPTNHTEVYKTETHSKYKRYCCKKGTKSEKDYLKFNHECRHTDCTTVKGDICQTLLPQHYVDDQQILLEETIRDDCVQKNGEPGEMALCCVKDSTDVLLTTLVAAEKNEFPHFVRLEFSDQCGGTVYNERYIITASHCVINSNHKVRKPSEYTVKIGKRLRAIGNSPEYKVVEIIPHPNSYKLKKVHESHHDDIALLKLDKDIKFDENIKALPIAPKGFDPLKYGDYAIVVGYGITDTTYVARKLQKTKVLLRNPEKNINLYKTIKKYGANQYLFVGGVQDGVVSPNTAQGDSGGPAICRDKDGYAVLCGATSMGGSDEECMKYRDQHHCPPSVFASISYHRDWIEKVAGDQSKAVILKQKIFGDVVPNQEYLHQVHISTSGGESCGGTLIEKDVVLTAAHCVEKENTGNIKVLYGVKDLSKTGGNEKKVGVTSVKIANGFSKVAGNKLRRKRMVDVTIPKDQEGRVSMKGGYYKNDLALLKLDKKIDGNVAKLPPKGSKIPGSATEVAYTNDTTRAGVLSKREFSLIEKNDCDKRLNSLKIGGHNIKYESNIICGVEKYSGGSACDRELGGGLICERDVVCGVQVFRLCESQTPSAFLDVSEFVDWIEANKN